MASPLSWILSIPIAYREVEGDETEEISKISTGIQLNPNLTYQGALFIVTPALVISQLDYCNMFCVRQFLKNIGNFSVCKMQWCEQLCMFLVECMLHLCASCISYQSASGSNSRCWGWSLKPLWHGAMFQLPEGLQIKYLIAKKLLILFSSNSNPSL